jgi:hypothetical protein
MEELFQQLIEAEILTEDVKKELEEVFSTSLNEAIEQAKIVAGEEVRAELTEQWINERDTLIEAVDTQVGEFLEEELNELKDDINRFRDLEAEYAEKLVESKAEMAANLEADMAELVEKIDAFLEIRLNTELEELKEDIAEVKKLEFGRQLFEGFVKEYRNNFVDESGVEAELREARQQAEDAQKALELAESKIDSQIRGAKLAELLEPLAGKQKDIMEAILTKLPTEQLEEGYKTFIGRVIKDSAIVEESEEKETPVLAEASQKDEDKKEEPVVEGVVKDGNTEDVLEESADDSAKMSAERKAYLQRLAGVIE